jgi:hypothetical protein
LEGKNQNHKTEKSQHKQKDTQMRFCFYQGHAEKMDFKFKLLPSPVNPKNLHLIKLFSILITIKGDFQQATKRNDFTPTYINTYMKAQNFTHSSLKISIFD